MSNNRYFTRTFNVATFDKYPQQEKVNRLFAIASTGDGFSIKAALIEHNISPAVIEYTVSKNAKSTGGKTILHAVLLNNQLSNLEKYDIAKYLIDNGAFYDISNDQFERPIHFAAKQQNWELVELLLRCKANPNSKDSNGRTPLHYALMPEKRECFNVGEYSNIFGGTKPQLNMEKDIQNLSQALFDELVNNSFVNRFLPIVKNLFVIPNLYQHVAKSEKPVSDLLYSIKSKQEYAVKQFQLKFRVAEAVKSYLKNALSPVALSYEKGQQHHIDKNGINEKIYIDRYLIDINSDKEIMVGNQYQMKTLSDNFANISEKIYELKKHSHVFEEYDIFLNLFDHIKYNIKIVKNMQLFFNKYSNVDKYKTVKWEYDAATNNALSNFEQFYSKVQHYKNDIAHPPSLDNDAHNVKTKKKELHILIRDYINSIEKLVNSFTHCAAYLTMLPWNTARDPLSLCDPTLIDVLVTVHYIALEISVLCAETYKKMNILMDYIQHFSKIYETLNSLTIKMGGILPALFKIMKNERVNPIFDNDKIIGYWLTNGNTVIGQIIELPRGKYDIYFCNNKSSISVCDGDDPIRQEYFEREKTFEGIHEFNAAKIWEKMYITCTNIILSVHSIFDILNNVNNRHVTYEILHEMQLERTRCRLPIHMTNLPLPKLLPKSFEEFLDFDTHNFMVMRQVYLLKMSSLSKIYVEDATALITYKNKPPWHRSYNIGLYITSERTAAIENTDDPDKNYAVTCIPIESESAKLLPKPMCSTHEGNFKATDACKFGNSIGVAMKAFEFDFTGNITFDFPLFSIIDIFVNNFKHYILIKIMNNVLANDTLLPTLIAAIYREFNIQQDKLLKISGENEQMRDKIKIVIWTNICRIIDAIMTNTLISFIEIGASEYVSNLNNTEQMTHSVLKSRDNPRELLIGPAKTENLNIFQETFDSFVSDNKINEYGVFGYGKFSAQKNGDQCVQYNINDPTNDSCYGNIDEKTILELIKNNADINSHDNSKLTPLLMAILMRKKNIVLLLLQHGANGTQGFAKCREMINDLIRVSPFNCADNITQSVVLRIKNQTQSNYVPNNIKIIVPSALYLLDHQITAYMGTYPNTWTFNAHHKLHKLVNLEFVRNLLVPLIRWYRHRAGSLEHYGQTAIINKKEENERKLHQLNDALNSLKLQKRNLNIEFRENNDQSVQHLILKINSEINNIETNIVLLEGRPTDDNNAESDGFDAEYQTFLTNVIQKLNLETNVIKIYEKIFVTLQQESAHADISPYSIYLQMWSDLMSDKTYRDQTQMAHAIYDFVKKNNNVSQSAFKTNFFYVVSVFKKIYSNYSQRYFDSPQNLDVTDSHNILNQIFNIIVHVVHYLMMPYFVGAVAQKIYSDEYNTESRTAVEWTVSTIKNTQFETICMNELPEKLVKISCKLFSNDDNKDIEIGSLLEETIMTLQTSTTQHISSQTLSDIKNTIIVYFKEYFEIMIKEIFRALVIQLKIFLDQTRLFDIAMSISNALR